MPIPSTPPDRVTVEYLTDVLRECWLPKVVTVEATRAMIEVMRIHGVLKPAPTGLDLVDKPGATRKLPREAAQALLEAFCSLASKPPFIRFAKLIDYFRPSLFRVEQAINLVAKTPPTALPPGPPITVDAAESRRLQLQVKAREEAESRRRCEEEIGRLVWERDDTVAEFGAAADPHGGTLVDHVIARAKNAMELRFGPPQGPRLRDQTGRLELDVERQLAVVDGEEAALGPAAARVLELLIEAQATAPENWTTGKALKFDQRSEERVDRVINALPPRVRAFIESKPGIGYRLKLE
jgi:hypothetical protein